MFGWFNGEHDNKIDSKGRLSIPADFRRELEDGDPRWEPGGKASMVILLGDHRRDYLEVLPLSLMNKRFSKIKRMSPGSPQRDALERLYFRQSVTLTVDDTGRIVLTTRIREKLGLHDQAKVVGNGETFHIWEPSTFHEKASVDPQADATFDPNVDPSVYLTGDDDD